MWRSIDRRLFLLTIAVFIVMLGVGVVSPILPAYIESLSATHLAAGIVIAGFGLARLVLDLPAGFWADAWGRKPLMVAGLLIFAASGVVAVYAADIRFLLATRLLQGAGAALYAVPANAYVADIAPAADRGRYMGQFQAGFFLGTATGPALGGVLADVGGLALPFWVLTMLSLVSAVFAWRFIPPYETGSLTTRFQLGEVVVSLGRVFRTRAGLLAAVVSVALFMMTAGIRLTGIPLLGAGRGYTAADIGLIISVIAFVNFVGTILLGGMSDRLGRRLTLIAGFGTAAVAIVAFVLAGSFASTLAVAVGFGVGTSILIPAQSALAVDLSHPAHRGVTLSAYRLFNDLGLILGPVLVGLLADVRDVAFGFVGMAAVCVVVTMFASVVKHPHLPGET